MPACHACGTMPPPGGRFCGQCGTPLADLQPAAPGSSSPGSSSPGSSSPAAALPAETASALRRSERKLVTVLFADIKGSLALVAGQDPELAGELLGLAVACMSDAVRHHGGLVNQVMGDGIMALFGAPIAMEDHAAQACRAALAMRTAIHDQVRPRIQLRVGLGSGEVVVRAVSGDLTLHYSAAGEAVHLASRMEQGAGPDRILLTPETAHLAAAAIVTRPIDPVVVKGLEAPMPVFELLGPALDGGAPAADHLARAPTRMVGRGREMALLRAARDDAARGNGRAIRLHGEAGAGKSRLVAEFTASDLGDWQLCRAEAVPHRRTSHGVTGVLLERLFALAPGDDAPVRRDKVAAGLGVDSRHATEALAPLSALLGLDASSPGWAALDGVQRRERTIRASVGAFADPRRGTPLAVVVEDAHWLDPESATSLARLAAAAPDHLLLALLTERTAPPPGTAPSASAGPGATSAGAAWDALAWTDCQVDPLDETTTLVFLRSRLIPGPDVADLERKLIEHTSGNPLFLEECLQALVETGELARVGDAFRLDTPVQVLRMPNSLRGLLDARVDRLHDADKAVLQAAAVVGSTVPHDLLQPVMGLDAATLAAALERLCRAGFLRPGSAGPRAEPSTHVFRHGLVRESAYRGTLLRRRVHMHGAVLAALEARPGPDDPVVDVLADHAVQAEDWPKAVHYARRAAVRAFDRYANPEALRYYEQALLAARALPETEARDDTLHRLHLGVRGPLFRLGQVAALRPNLDEAVRLAGRQPGHEGLAQALIMRSHVHWLRGDPASAMGDVATVLALARRHGDAELQVRARFQRGLVSLSQSNVAETVADMDAVVAHMGPRMARGRYGLDADLVVNAHCYAARAHAAEGDLAAARAACRAALELAASCARQTRIYAQLADSVVALAEGRTARALRAAIEADDLCRQADVRLLSPVAAALLAEARLAAGEAGQALPLVQGAVQDAARMGFMALQPQRLVVLGRALLTLDRPAEAFASAQDALALARSGGESGAEAAALGLVAAAITGQGGNGEPLRQEAAALATRLGLRPLAAALGLNAAGVAGPASPCADR